MALANDDGDREYIKHQTSGYIKAFEALKANKQIDDFKIGDASTLWSTWTERQRRLWKFYDRTGIRKSAVKRYRRGLQKIYDKQFDNGIEAVDELNEYEDKHKKYWFSSNPHDEITFTVSFKPIHPVEYVKIDLEFPPETKV